ncbi:MAG: hypothetical protein FWG98_13695 [Candidatus Cloacimonetes bacterium]|nr:hypothetical protein [Candidatus Cloacimonadota bacterium]
MATTSCTESNPIQNKNTYSNEDKQIGELFARLFDSSAEGIEDLLASYANFELKLAYLIHESLISKVLLLSYNENLISEYDLLKLLEDDNNVHWASTNPPWTRNEMTIRFRNGAQYDEIEKFILDYSEYKMSLVFHDKISTNIRVSFDNNKLDEFEFQKLLLADSRVSGAGYTYQWMLPNWQQGKLIIHFKESVTDELINSFLKNYNDYNFVFTGLIVKPSIILVEFDHIMFDEFDLLELIGNDITVLWVEFSYYDHIGV